ncbi:aquaporin family protein [Candidatus Methylopumilus rimovensis]|jgi:glycerol uptake facilitator-like aquaporin|uniref:Aquaporin family protein n=1 Tax=Candidatus Methylopumilus rimovensis TaxID=2588535 RepID=A0AAE6FU65_9PROT|nr:aquaporin [Candidatus Methylopumilus rimovensis]QDD14050.1 aquaporin family protein [Candidatus Methylopumilus rimovensis]
MLNKKYLTEFFGTAGLLSVITGSGFMGQGLAAGNDAVTLLGNSIATGAGLYVLIMILGPISGAHFNPLVSVMAYRQKQLKQNDLLPYIASQITGAISGVWMTHLMFNLPIIQASTKIRTGLGIWVSELMATLILLTVIYLGLKYAKKQIAMIVALTVTAGYWFTSSTFFCNPAVTFARSLTDTFVGIAPQNILGFVIPQVIALMLILKIIKK